MTGDDLIEWRAIFRLSKKDAAEILGCGRNSLLRWERGAPIPRSVALACSAYALQIPPWKELKIRAK